MTSAIKYISVLAIMALYLLMIHGLSDGEILILTGFEEDEIGRIPEEPPDTWKASNGGIEVSDSQVKEGKQSLAILGGGGDQALGAFFETQSQVITAEFWLYVDGDARSLTVFVQDPNVALTDWASSGPYLNWIGGKVRHYPGAWEEIGDFPSGEWLYIRLVVDTANSAHDVYVGDSLAKAHAGEPLGEGLGFRSDIAGPPGKVCFGTYAMASPAYIDNLLIYEGDVLPKGVFTVEPQDKLTITWGKMKKRIPEAHPRYYSEF